MVPFCVRTPWGHSREPYSKNVVFGKVTSSIFSNMSMIKILQTTSKKHYEIGVIWQKLCLVRRTTFFHVSFSATDNTTNSCNFCLRLKFNFTAKIQSNDSVKAAEFHIYKDAPKYAWMQNASFVVELSMITKAGNFIKLRKQLARRVILGGKIGWEVFDVTSPVDVWRIPANNYGLEVSVTFPRQGFPIPVDPGTFGLVGFTGPYGQRPFIVSFFKGDPTEGELVVQASNRKRRSSFSPRKLKYANKASSTECKMRHFYVDFQEIGWSKWIVHPKGYELNYCAGECSFPLSVSHNATNHATVQVLVSLLNPDSAPPPCCAPTKLKPISVLYFDDRQNIVLKKYHDMIVASCGCL